MWVFWTFTHGSPRFVLFYYRLEENHDFPNVVEILQIIRAPISGDPDIFLGDSQRFYYKIIKQNQKKKTVDICYRYYLWTFVDLWVTLAPRLPEPLSDTTLGTYALIKINVKTMKYPYI